ncbi:DUF4231 domain-containing protein [Amycolatopsis sp. NPDC051903]|uniref:DUF4231 domain-containing protein n=1 Tax=Amycolatopsis sp. NPDC051903 TaxID=3363936 RepID=UPI0037A61599
MGLTEAVPAEHWMVTGTRGGKPLPEVVVRRWVWFCDHARRSRIHYVTTEFVGVVCAAAVPVFAALRWDVAFTAIAGALVLIATTIRTVLGFHDDWIEYVRLRFALERDATAYLYRIAPYDKSDDDAERLLVTRHDELGAELRASWFARRKQLVTSTQPKPGPEA